MSIDLSQVYGLAVVGMGQAGKTEATKVAAQAYADYDPNRPTISFSNSNGFRGLTAAILREAGVASHKILSEADYLEHLATYRERIPQRLDTVDLLLDDCYRTPPPKEVLRSPAVNETVAYTSEDSTIRPIVTRAGARYLHQMITEPRLVGLASAPGLVSLDGRNDSECRDKFRKAGVTRLGTLVLTCDEDIVAKRLHKGAPRSVIQQETAKLEQRNYTDRSRCIARMTLPDDYPPDKLRDIAGLYEDSPDELTDAGIAAATDPEVCLWLATDRISLDEEREALTILMGGMLCGAQQVEV
jgi:hypothetical protein